jgi:hypothetical protein
VRKVTSRVQMFLASVHEQQHRCALSGVELTQNDAVPDHIVPVVDGGSDERENLQIVHWRVNQMKGRMTNDEFIGWCGKVWKHRSNLTNCTSFE